jgi:hypothetical protein
MRLVHPAKKRTKVLPNCPICVDLDHTSSKSPDNVVQCAFHQPNRGIVLENEHQYQTLQPFLIRLMTMLTEPSFDPG